ncbi:MAG: hypothetical protein HYX97_04430 [Chloroflexi bacterium]|nr:hypothetical protein [Chloroflexota bacterium]MBI2936210.1 hypothetical protein [Chloroflexota bacterium]
MNKVWGGFLAVTGFIACPCHLPLTLPLALAVLGGTGVGSFVGTHTGLIYGLATGYFIVAIGAGVYLWIRRQRAREGRACTLPSARRIEET